MIADFVTIEGMKVNIGPSGFPHICYTCLHWDMGPPQCGVCLNKDSPNYTDVTAFHAFCDSHEWNSTFVFSGSGE